MVCFFRQNDSYDPKKSFNYEHLEFTKVKVNLTESLDPLLLRLKVIVELAGPIPGYSYVQ